MKKHCLQLFRCPALTGGCRLQLVCLLAYFLCVTGESTVVINEFVASNGATLADEDGDYGDWIELYNRGTDPVMLHGWSLSDDPERPSRWRFPPVVVPGGEYLLVWATGKDRDDPSAPLHTNFSIAAAGEPLRLSRIDGSTADEVDPVELPRDISYGRGTGGDADRWFYFEEPTPGAENRTQAYEGLLEPPVVIIVADASGDGATVTIDHPHKGVALHYTLDGSRPDETRETYSGPFQIGQPPPTNDGLAWIQTSPPEMEDAGFPWLPPQGPVERVQTVRAKAVKPGYLPPHIASATWIPNGMRDAKPKIGIASITIDPDDLFHPAMGIYVPGDIYETLGFNHSDVAGRPNANYHQRGSKWERTAHIEYFSPNENVSRINGHVGLRIHGATSRALPQKSLRIYDRAAYNDERILKSTAFFGGNSAPSLLRTLILRNSGNDLGMTHLRCGLAQEIVRHLRFHTQNYAPVSLFINGNYWGIHNAPIVSDGLGQGSADGFA
ncbi:MAG: CotH kinase family protein, partial [Opitutales bacterium]|nr:CotH kinase family protein [Opitutales bacterium]